jgi:hypothetical protein
VHQTVQVHKIQHLWHPLAKARNDVASAAIRIWNAKEGKCVCILKVRVDYMMLDIVIY